MVDDVAYMKRAIALAKLAFYSSVCKKYTVYTLSTTQAMTDYQHIATSAHTYKYTFLL